MPVWAQGKGQGVEVLRVSRAVQQARPGEIVTLSFRLTNLTAAAAELRETLTLPPGWQPLVPPSHLTLGASETIVQVVGLAVSPTAAAGEYQVTYRLMSQAGPVLQDADTATIVVLPVRRMALLVEQTPDPVLAGEEAMVTLQLINRGNSPVAVRLAASTDTHYSATVEPTEASLAAGGQQQIKVTLGTWPQEPQQRDIIVQVQALPADDPRAAPLAATALRWPVLAEASRAKPPRPQISGRIALRLLGEDDGADVQLALSGDGYLDDAKTRRLSFNLQAPDAQDRGLFGQRDEYWLDYADRNVGLRLGDHTFGLSPLTEVYRYGRGVGLDLHGGQTRLGAYLMQDRWLGGGMALGAYGELQLNEDLAVRLNYLDRNSDALVFDRPDARIFSIQSHYRHRDRLNLELEYGRSLSDAMNDAGDAYRIALDGRLARETYYSMSKVHAAPDFAGAYRDCDYTAASVGFPLSERLRGHAGYGDWKQNSDGVPVFIPSAHETLWESGLTYDLTHGWNAGIEVEGFTRRTGLGVPTAHWREHGVRVFVSRARRNTSLRAEVRGAAIEDLITGETSEGLQALLSATWRPSSQLFLSGYGGFGHDPAAQGSRLLSGGDNLGLAVAWRPRPDLRVDVYGVHYGWRGGRRGDQLHAQVTHTAKSGQCLRLAVHRDDTPFGGANTSYLLEYSWPFDLPVGASRRAGGLAGRVVVPDDGGGVGLAGVVVIVGGVATRTAAEGRFRFPSLPPGEYLLTVQQRSIGLERVPLTKLPLPVSVVAGQTARAEVQVATAAQFEGRIVLAGLDTIEQADSAAPQVLGEGIRTEEEIRGYLRSIVAVLTDGETICRRMPDQNGEFSFTGLRPGKWHLRLLTEEGPTLYDLDRTEMDLILEAGESERQEFKLTPRRRNIKFVDADQDGPVVVPAHATP